MLPEWSGAAQERLAGAQVAIRGATPEAEATALWLAGTGVGRLVVAPALGLAETIAARTPLCHVVPDTQEIAGRLDVAIDAGAGPAERELMAHDAARAGHPWLWAAGDGWDGQVGVVDPRAADAPCLACVFPESEPRDSEAPAPPLAAWVGALAAMETVRCLTAPPAAAQLHVISALAGDVRRFRLRRDPGCRSHS